MSQSSTPQDPSKNSLPDKEHSIQREKSVESSDTVNLRSENAFAEPGKNSMRLRTLGDEKLGKDAIIAKLRSANEALKKQVKDLNTKLEDKALIERRLKPKLEAEASQSEEVLKKQLQNAYKQIDSYKKQLQLFLTNPEAADYFERLKKLEDQLAEKDVKIEELQTENKVLEKLSREQDKELETYRNATGYEKKVTSYIEEVRCLREKISNMQAINRHNEHSFKKQQEHLVCLTRQYRLLCEKVGISPSLNFTRAEDLDRILSKRGIKSIRYQGEPAEEGEESYMLKDNSTLKKMVVKTDRSISLVAERDIKMLDARNLKKLKESGHLTARKTSPEDKFKKEIETLNTKIFLLETEKKAMKNKLRDNRIIVSKNSPLDVRRSMVKHRSLSRINLPKNSDSQQRMSYGNLPHEDSNTIPTKSSIDSEEQNRVIAKGEELSNLQSTNQRVKKPLLVVRKATGGRIEAGLSEFSDKDYLPNPVTSKITKLMIWLDENFIYGIQAFYSIQDSYYVAGEEHIGLDMKRRAKFVTTVEIAPDDQIWWISGKYQEGITYLKLKTVKGLIKEFGTKKDSPQEFKISLDPHEKLTLLHGAFYYKKGDENNDDLIVLANIGFTLVKEEI